MKRLINVWEKADKLVVGLMSGTSFYGIDAALVKVHGSGKEMSYQLLEFLSVPYEDETRRKIMKLMDPEQSRIDEVSSINFLLGRLFSDVVVSLIEKASMLRTDIDIIGSHGHTFFHIPNNEGNLVKSSLQLGEASVLAEEFGCPVISDFRVRDIAAGGEGAPLVPYTDYLLFSSKEKSIALQNIGGIGNVTYLPKNGTVEDVTAFDTGPGNMVIDAKELYTNGKYTYDYDGEIASKGNPNKHFI